MTGNVVLYDLPGVLQLQRSRRWLLSIRSALHGFLKRTRIGTETTLNLEFHLPDLPEHLELSVPFKALSSSCRRASARPQVSYSAVAFENALNITLQPLTKQAPWTLEEDAISVKMRKEGHYLWK